MVGLRGRSAGVSQRRKLFLLFGVVGVLLVVVFIKWQNRHRTLEDGLHELGAALVHGRAAPHFNVYIGQKPLSEQDKAKLLAYLRQTYITDPIEKVEIISRGSLPFLHIQTKATDGTPGYLIIAPMKADEGAAMSVGGLLEKFWGYQEIGKEGRAARHAGETIAAYAKLCLRDGPALESLGVASIRQAFPKRTGSWEQLSDYYRELAEANTPKSP